MFQALWKTQDARRSVVGPNRPAAAAELDGDALFEALVCEFHWMALQVGALSHLFNAGMRGNNSVLGACCRNNLPADSVVAGLALKSWQSIGLNYATAQLLAGIYLNLFYIKQDTESFLASLSVEDPDKHFEPKVQQLAASWRNLAVDTLSAALSLEAEIRARLPVEYSRNTDVLAAVLDGAVKGRWDLVDPRGGLNLPALPQRRREQRFVMLQPCQIWVKDSKFHGMVKDLSRSGMKLSCKAAFAEREPLEVRFNNGRRFQGFVVWTNGVEHGVRLNSPLSFSDPIFTI